MLSSETLPLGFRLFSLDVAAESLSPSLAPPFVLVGLVDDGSRFTVGFEAELIAPLDVPRPPTAPIPARSALGCFFAVLDWLLNAKF